AALIEGKHVLLLLLLLVVELLSQGCCQHWSYDMSPGVKRQSGSLSETMGNVSNLPIHNVEVEVGLFTLCCDGAYPMMGGMFLKLHSKI
uniref:Gonadoliberin n=1 Tax=Hucho hucho TaxID=62062 RepID=A0A4W5LL29_9TELE